MICALCQKEVPLHARNCPSCQSDVGFPNVRATETDEELKALEKRLEDAFVSTRARGCKHVLDDFGRCIVDSKAVLCRSLGLVLDLVSSENKLYISYQQQVSSGSRLPKEDYWELGRPAVEATLFPHYSKEINFMGLTLSGRGLTSYGAYSVTLKDQMISRRASVFEENPFYFMQKHKVVVGDPIPPGFRASWGCRDKLAMAKLHGKIESSTLPQQFPDILMKPGANAADDEFIEVHVFGPIHPTAFDNIIGPKPTKRDDLVLWKSLKTKCAVYGIRLEES